MKVYIVKNLLDYEGFLIEAVYAKECNAKKHVERCSNPFDLTELMYYDAYVVRDWLNGMDCREELGECREMLLEVIRQACSPPESYVDDNLIDNLCLSAYEHATEYLHQAGLLDKVNGRIYKIPNKSD